MSKVVYDDTLAAMVVSGMYRVTTDGRILTCRQWRGRRDVVVPWYVCDRPDGRGYMYVSHRMARVKAHRLAYMLYHSVASLDGLEVNHLDGDPMNNREENLEVCDARRQSKHAFDIGLNACRGERHHHAKLTPKAVRDMRKLHKAGLPYTRIAELYAVTPRTAKLAIQRETWAHID